MEGRFFFFPTLLSRKRKKKRKRKTLLSRYFSFTQSHWWWQIYLLNVVLTNFSNLNCDNFSQKFTFKLTIRYAYFEQFNDLICIKKASTFNNKIMQSISLSKWSGFFLFFLLFLSWIRRRSFRQMRRNQK